MDRRDRDWLELRFEALEGRVAMLEDRVDPLEKRNIGITAVLTVGQKLATLIVIACAVAGVVLQAVVR